MVKGDPQLAIEQHLMQEGAAFARELVDWMVRANGQAALKQARKRLKIVQGDPAASKVACSSGCAYCCYIPVFVTMPEAQSIAHFITLSASADAIRAELAASFASTKGRSIEALRYRNTKCPFLGGAERGGTCLVYDVRPLVCRSFTSPSADECKRVFEDPNYPGQSTPRARDFVMTQAATDALAGPERLLYEMRGIVLELVTGTPVEGKLVEVRQYQ